MKGTKLLKYISPYVWPLILMAIFIYCQVSATLALPDYMARIINEGIIDHKSNVILDSGLIMMLIAIGGSLAAVVVGYLSSRIAAGFAQRLREAVFTKVESFSLTWIMAVAVVGLIFIIAVLFRIIIPKFSQLQRLVDKLNLVTREFLLKRILLMAKTMSLMKKWLGQLKQLMQTTLFVLCPEVII